MSDRPTVLGVICALLGSLRVLDLSHNNLGPEGGAVVAEALKVSGSLTPLHLAKSKLDDKGARAISAALAVNDSLTECNISNNNLDLKSAKLLAEVAAERHIMLFGIKFDQEVADLSSRELGPVDAVLIASDMAISSSLTECNVRGNNLDVESAKLLAKVATEKCVMLFGIKRNQVTADFSGERLDDVDTIIIASDVTISSSLTSLNLGYNGIGYVGGKAIAEALRVNGSLTSLNLRANNIGHEGGKAVAEAMRINGSLTDLNLWSNGIGINGGVAIADALLVNGSLTKIE